MIPYLDQRHKIETCIGNRTFGTDKIVKQALLTYPGIQTREWGCLGNCHRCFRAPFIYIDDSVIVEADSTEELWQRLCAHFAE